MSSWLVLDRQPDESVGGGADGVRADDHAARIDPHDDGVRPAGDVELDRRRAVWILQETVAPGRVDKRPDELSARIQIPDRRQLDRGAGDVIWLELAVLHDESMPADGVVEQANDDPAA